MNCLLKLHCIIQKLNSSSSNLSKQKVLSLETDTEILKLISIIYDKRRPFHVTSKNVLKYEASAKQTKKSKLTMSLIELLLQLESRKVTGHQALDLISQFKKSLDNEEHQNLLLNIIDKDLKIRMNAKSINKAIPGLIPVFPGIALCKNYEPELIKSNDTCLVSRKLDGVRCITIINSQDDIKHYSREGTVINVLSNLTRILSDNYIRPMVLDGEIIIKGDSELESFKSIMELIHKKNFTIENPEYHVFDCLEISEFENETSKTILSERLQRLSRIVGITVVEQLDYKTHFEELLVSFRKNNWEGLIVRKNVGYKGKRSSDILKVKDMHTAEYKVLQVYFTTMQIHDGNNYKEQECLKSVDIQHPGKSKTTNVGSGFTVEERIKFGLNPDLILGKIITVQYFSETQDSLRFPIFQVLHGNQRIY